MKTDYERSGSMKSVFRTVSRSLNPIPSPSLLFSLPAAVSTSTLLRSSSSFPGFCRIPSPLPSRSATFCSASMADGETHAPSLEKQFESFRVQLEGSGTLRDRIRAVAMEIDSTTRLMHSSLLLVHQSRPLPEVLQKAKAQIGVLKDLYRRLAEILQECPGQYYRFHGDWRSETQTVVSHLAFMHWLETENLIMHEEAAEMLGLSTSEFGLDVEDYLVGVCFMSNELPRYVVNQVISGDYDCPRKVLKFLTDLNAAFRMLNLRNDFLRKKFDSLKYDLRKVEEVYYDVKIRGLASDGNPTLDQAGVQE